jgi:hypothetical protein
MSVSTVSIRRLISVCFLGTALTYGSLMGLWTWCTEGSAINGAVVGAVGGVAFGASMTAVLVSFQLASARQAGGTVADVHQTDAFLVSGDIENVKTSAERAMQDLRIAPVLVARSDAVVLEGRTRLSWMSWGEIVRIEVGPQENGNVLVHVASRPALRTTIIDYGRSLNNVSAIRAAMSPHTPRPDSVSRGGTLSGF